MSVRFRGRLASLAPSARQFLLERSFSSDPSVTSKVTHLLSEVRAGGDEVLRRLTALYDRAQVSSFEVPLGERRRALAGLEPSVRTGLERAARNLERVARAMLPGPVEVEVEPGVIVGRRADPFERVGVYAPGGKAAYPSSVLMGVVPARAAGVKEILVCSPPGANGLPSDVVLAAAELSGADRVFAVGGAGAIAALAYGTVTIPRVDRIVGPGNAWVAEAKRQVAGEVGIDSPAGPSEILIVADDSADADVLVRELLAQAEHDVDACCVALVQGDALAALVLATLEAAVAVQQRSRTIETALSTRGAVLTLGALEEAWPFVEAFAAEHVLLALRDPDAALSKVRNAGTVFVGETSSVVFGDYLTGANHVLPTAGAARRFSGLSVLDFVRWTTWQRVSRSAAASFAHDVQPLAASEGLPAHAAAAAGWKSGVELAPASPSPRLRPTLSTIARYVPPRPACEIDLTDNTNLFGASPAVAKVLGSLNASTVTRYPSPFVESLRAALALEAQVPAECIVTGCGSDDVIDATVRAFAEPGEMLAYCPPTFGIVPTFAQANGVVPKPFSLDVDALASSGARLIYLCSPNNPTGDLLPKGFLDALLARTRAVVLLDEAYVDYSAQPGHAALAAVSQNLVVLRTLSKAFGLAGLRVGWAVASPRLVAEIEKTRGPYKVGNVAERAALAALTEDRQWVAERAAETVGLRARFAAALVKRGFSPRPSEANFVLVPVAMRADALAIRMRELGVSVRAFSGLTGIGEAVRITIGPWPMLERCLDALTEASR